MADVWNNVWRLDRAAKAGDYRWLAGWMCGRWEVIVEPVWVMENMPRWLDNNWSDGTWAMYWKTRLINAGKFDHETGSAATDQRTGLNPLHVGFLWLDETDEMLEVLRRPEPEDAGAKKRKVATPGIERVMTAPEPIDRVAARVTHNPLRSDGKGGWTTAGNSEGI